MKVDFDRTSKTGKANSVPINQGAAYTALSRAKTRSRLLLVNFDREHIKVNAAALNEMKRMREQAVFNWSHPIIQGSDRKMVLLNLRSWTAHIQQFITDTEITNNCDIMCFVETHTRENNFSTISQFLNGWDDIHLCTQHGLAFCYRENRVKVIEKIHAPTTLEVLTLLLNIQGDIVLFLLLYRPPGPIHGFIDNLMEYLEDIILSNNVGRVLILGDFNLDQMLEENINRVHPLIHRFGLHQRSRYSTHIQGGILDLVFDSKKSEIITWIPSPYTDHFTLCIEY